MNFVKVLPVIALACGSLLAQAAPPAAPPAADTGLKGEVLETLNVDSYTYLRLKTKSGETWAAVPTTTVKKGAQVTIGGAMTMDNFESKQLKRKFDHIVFGELIDPSAKPASANSATVADAGLKGEVLETLNVEGYTYLRLKTKNGETWAAVPTTAVKKGAQVSIGSAMTMDNFESKQLKRKFDHVVFGVLADPNAKPAAVHAPAPAAAPVQPVGHVTKATGPDAKTVAEVVKGRAALKDKTATVRGQVVKMNGGIMGKNWLHLQDGSGSATDGSNDILVTTKDGAAIGDVVSVKGTVRTDVNLGAGYAYAVLIENASVSK